MVSIKLAMAVPLAGAILPEAPSSVEATSQALDMDVDPSRLTCLLPIEAGTPLSDSIIWQVLLDRGHRDAREELAKHGFAEDEEEATVGVMRLVNTSATRDCEALAQQHRLTTTATSTTSPVGVLHEGEDCWIPCDERGGLCRSGFCGAGYCCRAGDAIPGCHRQGCVRFHCCTAPVAERVYPPCDAKPGAFCVSSLAVSQEKNLTAVQMCALQRSISYCPVGFYCPGGKHPPVTCRPGTLCLGRAAGPQPCPAGYYCPASIWRKVCPPGLVCNENSSTPGLCWPGHYCPDGKNIVCPRGHFCPPGAVHPRRCARLAMCPEGSEMQGWGITARIALVIALTVWTLTLRSVPKWLHPKGGMHGALPTAVSLGALVLAWVAKLDLIYSTAKTLDPKHHDPKELKMDMAIGGSHDTMALMFITLTYSILAYGFFVSALIRNHLIRLTVDSIFYGCCFALCNLYLKDRAAIAFMGIIVVASRVLWMFFARQGALWLRISILFLSFMAVGSGFVLLQARGLAVVLAGACLSALVKELLISVLPLLAALLASFVPTKVRACEGFELPSVGETPFQPLIDSLATAADLHGGADADAQERHANAAAAAARVVRLAACRSASGSAEVLHAANDESWALWLKYFSRNGDPESARGPLASGSGSVQSESRASSRPSEPSESGAAFLEGVSFDVRNMSVSLNRRLRLLKDLTFKVPPGAMVAIMGASGSGKTTLLNAISGRCEPGHISGELRLNGRKAPPHEMAELRALIGYVPQDDVVHSLLTVRENIEFQAELRLPRQTPDAVAHSVRSFNGDVMSANSGLHSLSGAEASQRDASIASSFHGGDASRETRGHHHALSCGRMQKTQEFEAHVDGVVMGLGLSSVRDRLVGNGLSGGQRKRVSIGMELVSKPPVLMLDEPSSGLDSSTCHRLLGMVLSGSRDRQCTTFATLHQPRWATLCLFDMLIMLAPGGYLVFAGPVSTARYYFGEVLGLKVPEDENPADVIVEACTFESARKLVVDGHWKHPPQCLRSVLLPTPETSDDEVVLPGLQEEFGQILAEIWEDFVASKLHHVYQETTASSARSSHGTSGKRSSVFDAVQPTNHDANLTPTPDEARSLELESNLAQVARERAQQIHWGHQIWLQVARALLVLNRALWPTVALTALLLVVAMMGMGWAFPGDLSHFFLQSGLMLMLLGLVQSVAAQRLLGGDESRILWREGSVCSPSQTLYSFLGKDMASLVEITMMALTFTLTYWPMAHTCASGADLFSIGFAYTYAVWGLAHIWAVLLPRHTAMLFSVVFSFISFLCAGLKPEAYNMVKYVNGYGALLLLASPIKWAHSHWIFRHVTGRGSTYQTPSVEPIVAWLFQERGFKITDMKCPTHEFTVVERVTARSGWMCHNGQLFLLGFLYRFVAAVCMLAVVSARSSGGRISFGISSPAGERVLRDLIGIFFSSVIVLNVWLLGFTY